MSIVLGYSAPVLGMGNSFPLIVRQALSAISAAGGDVLDFACLQTTLANIQDQGEYLLALEISSKCAAAGGSILDMSCLYQLAKSIKS